MGWESMGKSTLSLAKAQAFARHWLRKKEDKWAVLWIETESALDKARAHYMNVPINRFLISECETVEDGFELIEATLKKCEARKAHLLIVWDTIAAAPTRNEIKDLGFSTTSGDLIQTISKH